MRVIQHNRANCSDQSGSDICVVTPAFAPESNAAGQEDRPVNFIWIARICPRASGPGKAREPGNENQKISPPGPQIKARDSKTKTTLLIDQTDTDSSK